MALSLLLNHRSGWLYFYLLNHVVLLLLFFFFTSLHWKNKTQSKKPPSPSQINKKIKKCFSLLERSRQRYSSYFGLTSLHERLEKQHRNTYAGEEDGPDEEENKDKRKKVEDRKRSRKKN